MDEICNENVPNEEVSDVQEETGNNVQKRSGKKLINEERESLEKNVCGQRGG